MIQVKQLCKAYKSGRSYIDVLSQVTAIVPSGTALAISGKSGSGKTTLLNCIGGLEKPDSGSVNCLDVDIHKLTPKQLSYFQRRNMGFVFQFGNLLPYLTVAENIAFPLILNHIETEKRVDELLEKVMLQGLRSAMPHELSGGETQRIAFARAIAHSPQILLADEPTASLDTESGELLVQMMFDMCRNEGCTVIMSTHDRNLIRFADTCLTLLDGKMVGE